MSNSLSHHDALFKKFLGNIAVARDFLDIHLPASLRERCDLSTLAMESSTFIKDNLRSFYSDMLYSVQTTREPGYIYTVIEHQSRPEKMMPYRMLRYCLEAMQQHLDQGHKQLPVVIPLLFYHGRTSPYPYTTCWLDCFADPELAESVYSQAFPLIDITAMPDDEIMTHRRVAVLELIQKHIRTRDMLELSNDIAQLLNQWSLPHEQFRSMLFYLAQCGNTSDAEQFLQNIARQTTDYKEDVMTIAEQLRQKGILIGKQIGAKDNSIKIARELIASGIERSVIIRSTKLTEEELDSLMALQ
ncbi:Rpn family recombination-promoting nuclease/putative transposase [Acerihabitans sp. TG2]|uniref:Rpn family recombination-promoting nuclease/putative transposase n=1 Tax=Acerihabitans sp. TG2 TaxID=3096008 RepID=UPI002B222D96|nr:Rpn family recombination-promoting nuclease/putative transposase [Acerihabitans sp. TG2]MEA9390732.1 Rpn family recombination-promoting nuclease/putative transposase [Acerihabitans sp. TG2]